MSLVSENFIDKRYTNIIKGVALIFMFVHHFYTFPDRIICGAEYEHIDAFALWFHDALKICVSVFAFLTGYFYFFNKKKTYKYSFKKSTDLYINYVVIFALMLVLDFLLKCYEFSVKDIALELLLLSTPNMEFCWYVMFFFIAMFLLPVFSKIADKSSALAFTLGVLVPGIVVVVLNTLGRYETFEKFDAIFDVIGYISWFPCVASGYIFAKEKIFQNMDVFREKGTLVQLTVYIGLIVAAVFSRNYNASFDFIYAPAFIFGMIGVLRMMPNVKLLAPVAVIGKYSLLMWFIHSVFFNVSKEFTQPILYYPHNPILVTVWGLIMCLAASVLLSFPINYIIKIKNKLFRL